MWLPESRAVWNRKGKARKRMKTFRRREEGKPEKGRKEAAPSLKPWLRSRMGCLAKCLQLGVGRGHKGYWD